MTLTSVASHTPAIQPSTGSVSMSAATDASIAAYLAAGERMRVIAGYVAIACLALMVLFVLAMAVGLIPVTVRPI